MRNLVIIGNSHAARECFHLFEDMLEDDPLLRNTIRFKGFLSHNGYTGNLKDLSHLSLGSDCDYVLKAEDLLVIGIADTGLRKAVFHEWKKKGAEFYTLISPTAKISRTCRLGEGNIIGFGCAFSCDITIGNANYLNSRISLGHDVQIGDNNFLGPGVMLLGGAALGDGNILGAASVVLPSVRMGNGNSLAPGAVLFKGCGNGKRLAGNPALVIGNFTS